MVGVIGLPDHNKRLFRRGADIRHIADIPQQHRQLRMCPENIRHLVRRGQKGVDGSALRHFRQVSVAGHFPEDGIRPHFPRFLRPYGAGDDANDFSVQVLHRAPFAPALRDVHRSDDLGQQDCRQEDDSDDSLRNENLSLFFAHITLPFFHLRTTE